MTRPYQQDATPNQREAVLRDDQRVMMDHLSMHIAVRSASDAELRYFYSYLDQKVRSAAKAGARDRYEKRRLEVESEIERRRPQRHRPHDPRPSATYHSLAGVDLELGGRYARDSAVSGEAPATQYPRQAADSPWSMQNAVESPLGYSVEDQEPNGTPVEVAASIARTAAPALPPGAAAVAQSVASSDCDRAPEGTKGVEQVVGATRGPTRIRRIG
jgi:hypothetical protein